MRFPASVKVLQPVWFLKKTCVKDIQVQNTCNEQEKRKHVDRWLKQIVQEYARKWAVMISFFLFAGAFDKSSSADDEGATETKNLWTE